MKSWYYWNCIHGPGHQSSDDGFFVAENDKEAEKIIEYREMNYNDPVIKYWKVKGIPISEHEKRLRDAKRYVAVLKAELKELKSESPLPAVSEKGRDEEIVKALTRRVRFSVLKKMHDQGIVITNKTYYMWMRGDERPTKAVKKKALSAIKRADKYEN
jgi:hypothetical protein